MPVLHAPRRLLRKLRSLTRHPAFERRWLLPVWLLLGLAKLAIFTLSFRRLAPWLGVAAGGAPWLPLASPAQEARALDISRAIRLAARYTPWDSNCFPQAIAARVLLALYGVPYALYFGLAREPGSTGMKAHAWVGAGRVRVTGGESFRHYTVVGTYVAPGLAAARPGEALQSDAGRPLRSGP